MVHAGDATTPDGLTSFEVLISGSEPVEDARRSGVDLAAVFCSGGTTGGGRT